MKKNQIISKKKRDRKLDLKKKDKKNKKRRVRQILLNVKVCRSDIPEPKLESTRQKVPDLPIPAEQWTEQADK